MINFKNNSLATDCRTDKHLIEIPYIQREVAENMAD